MLELENVSFRADNKYILKGINLSFKDNKTYILTGEPNGGKSLLMKIIGGITIPSEGKVLIDKIDVQNKTLKKNIKSNIGFIFQNGVLLSNLSIIDNLLLPIRYLTPQYDNKQVSSTIVELFEYFGLDKNLLGKRPSDVSYSERKIINIIRALLIDPKILLVNMPLFNLDYVDSKKVIDYLTKIKNEKLMIITTNNKLLMDSLADEIMLLDKGEIYIQCSYTEFFTSKNPLVKKYIKEHLGYLKSDRTNMGE